MNAGVKSLRVLFVEDEKKDAELLAYQLAEAGYVLDWTRVETEAAYLLALDEAPQVILSDFDLPRFSGLQALALLRQRRLDIPFILISGTIGEELAIDAIKRGADDYLLKDRIGRLPAAIEVALEKQRRRRDQRIAEDVMRETELRLTAFLENSPNLMSFKDSDGRYRYVNRPFEVAFGLSAGAMVGRTDQEMFPAAHAAEVSALDLEVLRTGKPVESEVTRQYVDGSRTLILNKFPLVGTNGKAQGIGGIAIDITDRKREEALYRATFDQAAVGIAHAHARPDGRLLRVNQKFCDIVGYSSDELLHLGFRDLTFADDLDVSKSLVTSLLAGRTPGSDVMEEKRYVRKDGRVIWASRSLTLVKKPSGEPDYFLVMLLDISDRKTAEERLRASFDQAAVGIALSETGFAGRYLLVNDKLCDMLGYTRAELLALQPLSITHADDTEEDHIHIERLLAGEIGTYTDEKRFIHKNGSIVWVTRSVSLVRDHARKPLHFIRVFIDITERKAADQAFREFSQITETRERMLTGMLSSITDHAYIYDRDVRFRFVNQPLLDLWGLTMEDVRGRNFADLGYPDDLSELLERQVQQVFASGKSIRGETPYVSPAGVNGAYEYIFSPVVGAGGAVEFVAGTSRDITERVLAGLKLGESEGRFRALTDLSADWYWEQDAEFRFTLNSDTRLAHSRQEEPPNIIGKTRWDLPWNAPTQAQWRQHRDDLEARRPFRDFEIPQVLDGKVARYASIDGEPMFDAQGGFTGYRGVGRDITARMRSIEDLQRLRLAIDATTDAIFVLDPTSLRLVHVNEAACRLQGQTRAELIASGPVGIIEKSQEKLVRDYDAVIAGGVPAAPREILRQRDDGSTYWIELRRHPVRVADGWLIVSVVRDISEQKCAEEMLRESERFGKSVIDSLAHHMCVIDEHGTILAVNMAWREFGERNGGIGSRTGVGVNYFETCTGVANGEHGPEQEFVEKCQRIVDGTLDTFELEYPCHSPNERRWFNAKVTRFVGEGPRRLIVTHLNITERVIARLKLQESENRFRSLTSLSSDWYWEQDAEFRFTHASDVRLDAAGNEIGVSILGKTPWELPYNSLSPEQWRRHRAQLDAHLPFTDLEIPQVIGNQAVRHISISGEPVFDAEGRFSGYRGVVSDITDRENARLKLMQSESRFRALTNLSSDWYWEQDAQFRFTDSSDARLDAAGNEIGPSIIGKTRWELPYNTMTPEQWQGHQAHLAAHLPFRDFEMQQVIGGETVRHISVSGEPIFDAEGRFRGYRGVGSDITEQVSRVEDLLRLGAAIDATPDAVYLTDRTSMRFVYVNDAACQILDRDREATMALEPWQASGVTRAELERSYDAVIACGVPADPVEMLFTRADGTQPWVEIRRHARFAKGRWMIVTVVRDITARKHAEISIERLNRVYTVLSGINTLIVRVRDRQLLFNGACRIAVEHGRFGAALVGVLDRATLEVVPAATAGALSDNFARPVSARADLPLGQGPVGRAIREKRAVLINDLCEESGWSNDRLVEAINLGFRSMIVLPLFTGGETFGVLCLFSVDKEFFNDGELKLLDELAGDISFALDYIGQEEKLNHMAYYDALTGLPNRVLFRDRLAQTLEQAKRNHRAAGVLFIDLDGFKVINDTMGHGVGDQLLQLAAARLKECIRSGDSAARFGGDEFAVVLSAMAEAQDASLVAQKVLNAFRTPFVLNGAESYVTASIGIATYPLDGDNIDALIKSADSAMYGAKAAGRNNYKFYIAELNQRTLQKIQLETRLRRAVERQEFLLYYQPKVNSTSGQIVGLEALLRWQSPDAGLVTPLEFIPALEEMGLIVPVGEWIWDAACKQIKAWEQAGIEPVPIAINLSARQFEEKGLDLFIQGMLKKYQVQARWVEVEITESSIMQKPDDAIAVLKSLRELGIRISVDDFGTGYSSLSYLKRFPLDTLKIDQSFVSDVTVDTDDAAIVRAIVTMAHSLNLKVIAEGVETEEQLAFLCAIHCEQAQGYLFSKPLAAADCTALLETRRNLSQQRKKVITVSQSPAVLLVDDDKHALQLLEETLRPDGYRILTAKNGKHALELLAKSRIGVVVCDENMPGISGVELLKRVRLIYPEVVRIMLSGSDDLETASAAINDSAVFKYFVKHRDDHLLREGIRQAVWHTELNALQHG